MQYFTDSIRMANLAERQSIKDNYQDNIVYQWLKLSYDDNYSHNSLLTLEDLFFLSFQFLDYLKQYEDFSDCLLLNDLQCIPYEINKLLDHNPEDVRQCVTDNLLAFQTLHILLTMIELPNEDLLEHSLVKNTDCFFTQQILPEWYTSVYERIEDTLTMDSQVYKHSSDIMSKEDYDTATKTHLIDYIQGYFASPQRISEEIATGKPNSTLSINNNEQDSPQLQQLKDELQKKDNEIAELKEKLNTFSQSSKGYVQINSKCKSKITAILSAMFYANYFHGIDISGRDPLVGHILKYGFHYPQSSISQLLSQYMNSGTGNLEDLKKELRESLENALKDLTQIQNKKN